MCLVEKISVLSSFFKAHELRWPHEFSVLNSAYHGVYTVTRQTRLRIDLFTKMLQLEAPGNLNPVFPPGANGSVSTDLVSVVTLQNYHE